MESVGSEVGSVWPPNGAILVCSHVCKESRIAERGAVRIRARRSEKIDLSSARSIGNVTSNVYRGPALQAGRFR